MSVGTDFLNSTRGILTIRVICSAWLRNILPSSALRVEEEAWNAYPYTRTIYKVPFVEKLVLDVETYFFDDAGEQDDVFNLSPDERKARIIGELSHKYYLYRSTYFTYEMEDFIDIVKDPITGSDYRPEEDPSIYVSEATGRGPLSPNWREEFIHAQQVTHETYEKPPTRTHDNSPTIVENLKPLHKRIMCAYKLCRVEFRYWGTQTRVEQFIHDTALRKTMLRAHRQVWAWQNEWYGLTIEEIRRLEEETAQALASKMADSNQPPNNDGELSKEVQSTTSNINETMNATEVKCNQSDEKCESESSTATSEKFHLPINSTDIAEQNLWADFKKLEANNFELDDFEPFTAPCTESDDDTRSFVTCCSDLTGNTDYATPLASNFQSFDIPGIKSCFNQKPISSIQQNCGKLVLILVIHGGCILDSTYDLTTKRSDILTFRKTIETVTANHYPTLHNRIAVKLVPCPTEIGDIFRLFSKLKASPDATRPIETQLLRDLMPLGSIPLFLINSSGYSRYSPLSPFLFNFVVDVLLEMTLSSSKFPGVELLPGDSLFDIEYADDIVLFGEDADKMQSLLTTLSNNASMFGMRFSPSKCKMLLQDWVTSTPELVIRSEVIECVDRFTYLGSLISPCGLVCDKISARIQKARLAFANLRHLWHR
ncbi:unnamed protein product [Schistosoma margrebowiei]|uniref:Uncharacterized protein n=1 Tax=Schistosoma margrebowiei TaxID=48269 RepID=A0A183LQS0_9TREM|nr:unnamed protein product [Schistosoma margrebowiei]